MKEPAATEKNREPEKVEELKLNPDESIELVTQLQKLCESEIKNIKNKEGEFEAVRNEESNLSVNSEDLNNIMTQGQILSSTPNDQKCKQTTH